MSSSQGFSLFPTTVPKIAIPSPHKKNPSLHRISIVASPQSTVSNGESIVIKMEQEQPPLPQLPAHLGERRDSSPSPEDIGRAITTTSPIDGRTPTQPVAPSSSLAKYTPSLYQSPQMSHSSPQASFSLGTGSATTLVQVQTQPQMQTQIAITTKSPVDPSPIVPIRSMFPTYDPSIHLTKQPYAPQRPLPARLSALIPPGAFSREDYRSSLSLPFAASAQRTAPASILNFPSDVMSVNIGPRISTQRDLEKLWEASHGTEPDFAIKTFTLEMARTEEANFVFGSHPSLPFYTLQTYDTNEIAVTKTCPRKATSTRDVVLCPLEPASRRQPPNDGLVAFIFPKLAAMLAINQSAALARENNLAPTDRDEIEAHAVRRAAKQEACHLRFNARGGFYELEHPAIGRGAMGGDFAATSPIPSSPTTIRSITGKPVLHITISMESALPTIHVVDPNAARRIGTLTGSATPMTSAGQGIRRLSTLPQTDGNTAATATSESPALATLDLTAQTLFIDANGLLELMPSLFSIDSIVSAMLAVAMADATTNPALGSMEVWKYRPAPSSRLGHAQSIMSVGMGMGMGMRTPRPGSIKSHAGSTFYATIAEREEAEEEAKLMRQDHENDVRGGLGAGYPGSKSGRAWFGWKKGGRVQDVDEKRTSTKKGGKRGNKSKQQITMAEFDLEKLGHYQSGDRKGEELPVLTRSALSFLITGLKLLVWLMTTVVQLLAWILVNLSRAVTSEKF
ncbi:hypothetical protein LTR99_003504 [Exophiala xenobiotica]|uniref:Uncharacterized protein n=1 Tax=Vermiconidia calcicola TaxID=1690605 RepID=A0AAV9PWH2_9PEZI|nr:hypothetical protein LTR96_008189 [Exophiala xenobiotica]KAK5529125.1 hypothetical protein LTR25_009862 [Vermiconidia calcicola]KAK5547090.1 hypothetical protein LTR23_002729 [Chaetothyriales sp. CCFEE 6169]KAK5305959.1 hypothetical protein LTR99_003504 [Exophiala xenobiotica]KAK5335405.1 hypothetical protein LTR98_008405 [Exophiala xenobiotica]